jgi:hypothetical protein
MSEKITKYVPKPLTAEQNEVIDKLVDFGENKASAADKKMYEESVRWIGKSGTIRTLNTCEWLAKEKTISSKITLINNLIRSDVYPKLQDNTKLLEEIKSVSGDKDDYHDSKFRRSIKNLGAETVQLIVDNANRLKADNKLNNPSAYINISIDRENDRKFEVDIKVRHQQKTEKSEEQETGLGE